MAYDSVHHEALLFGGDVALGAGVQATAQTWIWNGSSWSPYGGTGPSARAYAAMDFDAPGGQIILYGGQYETSGESSVSQFDTWIWNGSQWLSPSLSTAPKLRWPVGTYDALHSTFVVFGVGSGGPETWLWSGAHWSMANPPHSPGPRAGEGMAYVSNTKQVVLFGGGAQGLGYLKETWVWNGSDWLQLTTPTGPAGRVSPTFVSGPNALLFGGGAGRGPLADVWEFDGSQWLQVNPVHVPSAREEAAGAFDGQYPFIVGGYGGGLLSDAWMWTGTDWRQC